MTKRAGRKRLIGIERWDNGKAKQEHAPVAELRRARDAVLTGMRQPEWGTVCGLLFLSRKLTPEQFAASKRFDEAHTAYSQAIGAGAARSASLEAGISSYAPDPESDDGRAVASREQKAVARYLAAYGALDMAGTKLRKAVCAAIQERQHPHDAGTLDALSRGLSRLADHYRLTNHRKPRNG